MPSITIIGSGRIDERDSAFPQAVELPDGEVLCSFCVGGGAEVTGGTECARSSDGGQTWQPGGVIMPPKPDVGLANFLKLSLSPDGGTIYAYGGPGNLAYRTAAGAGIADALVIAYLETDYINGRTVTDFVVARATTTIDGSWVMPMLLDPEIYALVYARAPDYGPDVKFITVV